MGEVVKTVLQIGAAVVGFAIGGPLGAAIAVAITQIGSSLLFKPKQPQTSASDRDRLFASIDSRAPRKIVYGNTAMATDIRDQEFTGTDQEYFHRFVVVASHRIEAVDTIYFDDEIAWSSGGGAQGDFAGYLDVDVITEGSAANAINISPRMGTSRRFTGLAYVHFRYKLTGNDKTAESPFAQSIPTRLTIIGRAMPIYDPRLDPTYGGTGTHDAADQSTWAWDDDFARNPALQTLNYLIGYRINGKLAVGKGIPVERLDIQSFIDAANLCDEPIALLAGGTEPRYRSDGIFSEADDMELVLDQFKAAMNAVVDDIDGQIAVRVLYNDLETPIASFDENDIIGNVDWNPVAALSEKINVLRGQFVDPDSLYQYNAIPEVAIASTDGIERAQSPVLQLVQSPTQGQRLLKQRLQRSQFAGRLKFEGQRTWWKVQKNDVVELAFYPLGFAGKLFRVLAMGMAVNGRVNVELVEEDAQIYAWDVEEGAAVVPAPPTIYARPNNPIIQSIDEASMSIKGGTTFKARFNFDGTAKTNQLPIEEFYKLELGDGTDVTNDALWSYALVSGALTAVINDGGTNGKLSVSALSADSRIRIAASYQGITKRLDVDFDRAEDATPISGGGGGTTGSDSSIEDTTNTAYLATPQAGPVIARAGASGEIRANISMYYERNANAAGSTSATAKIQWRLVGGSFADVGETTGTVAVTQDFTPVGEGFEQAAGALDISQTITGLVNGSDYEFQLLIFNSNTVELNHFGTLSAVAL